MDSEKSQPKIEMVLNVLQQGLLKKVPMCPYARLGGNDGTRLTRAAFSAMLKFCDKIDAFIKLAEDIEFTRLDLSSGENPLEGDYLANAVAL